MIAAFLVGDSHYAAVAGALAQRTPEAEASGGDGIHIYVFNGWKHSLAFPFSVAVDGRWVLNPSVQDEIEALSSGASDRVILSMFGGGHHHALTLIGHDQSFDCVLPEQPELLLVQGAKILTVGYVEAILMTYLPGPFREIQNFINAFPNSRCIHIESPPSNGDDNFVRTNLGRWFTDKVPEGEEVKLTPRLVRQKIWRIHSNLYIKQAAKANFAIIGIPQAAVDEEGFLKSNYFGSDATHANYAYGELILDQIESNLGSKIQSWSYFG